MTDPVDLAFAGLRLVAIALASYLVVATTLGIALRAVHAHALLTALDAVTVPFVRTVLSRTVGAGLTVSLAVPVLPPPPSRDPPVTMHRLADGTTSVSPTTMPLPPPTAPLPPPTLPSIPPPTQPAPVPAATTWRVRPGECFWTIAEAVLAGRRDAPPSDADLVPYWLRLIAANRDRLADRDNPDLIFPGQVFVVPPA